MEMNHLDKAFYMDEHCKHEYLINTCYLMAHKLHICLLTPIHMKLNTTHYCKAFCDFFGNSSLKRWKPLTLDIRFVYALFYTSFIS